MEESTEDVQKVSASETSNSQPKDLENSDYEIDAAKLEAFKTFISQQEPEASHDGEVERIKQEMDQVAGAPQLTTSQPRYVTPEALGEHLNMSDSLEEAPFRDQPPKPRGIISWIWNFFRRNSHQ